MDIEKYLQKVDKVVAVGLKILIPALGVVISFILVDGIIQICIH